MTASRPDTSLARANAKRLRAWAKQVRRYDSSIGFFERRVFGTDHRAWACARASGRTLEVAVGTGLNLRHYPPGIALSGIDLSPEMLAVARDRAARRPDLEVTLREGDAHALPFDDANFDTVVCTYSLCNIPDPHRAVGEMKRVLRPGGRLILVDHVRSEIRPVLWLQKAIEALTLRLDGDSMTRRPLEQVKAHGFDVVERERHGLAGVVERVVAIHHGERTSGPNG